MGSLQRISSEERLRTRFANSLSFCTFAPVLFQSYQERPRETPGEALPTLEEVKSQEVKSS